MTQIGSSILGPSLFVTVSCASMNIVAICMEKREENQLIVYYKHLTVSKGLYLDAAYSCLYSSDAPQVRKKR
jgi:hypothetical protein